MDRGSALSFVLNPALIGGMRIQVGSDVYDGSVQAGLAALEKSLHTTDGIYRSRRALQYDSGSTEAKGNYG